LTVTDDEVDEIDDEEDKKLESEIEGKMQLPDILSPTRSIDPWVKLCKALPERIMLMRKFPGDYKISALTHLMYEFISDIATDMGYGVQGEIRYSDTDENVIVWKLEFKEGEF